MLISGEFTYSITLTLVHVTQSCRNSDSVDASFNLTAAVTLHRYGSKLRQLPGAGASYPRISSEGFDIWHAYVTELIT